MKVKRGLRTSNEYLTKLEDQLQGLFQREVGDILQIGAILHEIKETKLYRYKSDDSIYTWKTWSEEFMGSVDTSNRYCTVYEAYEAKKDALKDFSSLSASKLYEIAPLLLSVPKEEAEELVELARNAPSTRELKRSLKERKYSLEELEDTNHNHQWEHRHYKVCTVCSLSQNCLCPKITHSESKTDTSQD